MKKERRIPRDHIEVPSMPNSGVVYLEQQDDFWSQLLNLNTADAKKAVDEALEVAKAKTCNGTKFCRIILTAKQGKDYAEEIRCKFYMIPSCATFKVHTATQASLLDEKDLDDKNLSIENVFLEVK